MLMQINKNKSQFSAAVKYKVIFSN